MRQNRQFSPPPNILLDDTISGDRGDVCSPDFSCLNCLKTVNACAAIYCIFLVPLPLFAPCCSLRQKSICRHPIPSCIASHFQSGEVIFTNKPPSRLHSKHTLFVPLRCYSLPSLVHDPAPPHPRNPRNPRKSVSNNPITAWAPDVSGLRKMKHLRLKGVGLDRCPDGLDRLNKLENLDLSDNSITEFVQSATNLFKLKMLDLSGNNIPVRRLYLLT